MKVIELIEYDESIMLVISPGVDDAPVLENTTSFPVGNPLDQFKVEDHKLSSAPSVQVVCAIVTDGVIVKMLKKTNRNMQNCFFISNPSSK